MEFEAFGLEAVPEPALPIGDLTIGQSSRCIPQEGTVTLPSGRTDSQRLWNKSAGAALESLLIRRLSSSRKRGADGSG